MPGLHRRTLAGTSDKYGVVARYAGKFTCALSTRRRSQPRPSVGHADRLGLQVFFVAFFAVAVAETALLRAAERAANAEVALSVDGHIACAHPFRHLERPLHV